MPTIHLTEPQARALADHGRFAKPPGHFHGQTRKALARAVTKLRSALDQKATSPMVNDLQHLTDVLLDVRQRAFVDLIHGRGRDLLHIALIWSAAEELPADVRAAVLDLDRLGAGGWAAEVFDLLDAHGIAVDLPGDTRR